MTGIFFYKNKNGPLNDENYQNLLNIANSIAHRGNAFEQTFRISDQFIRIYTNTAQEENNIPIFQTAGDKDKKFVMIDGDITNPSYLMKELDLNPDVDINVNQMIYQGYQKWGMQLFQKLEGMFSIVLGDTNQIVAAKDPIGFNPLYILETSQIIVISSELKALKSFSGEPNILQPGSMFKFTNGKSSYTKFFQIQNLLPKPSESLEDIDALKTKMFTTLDEAVRKIMKSGKKVRALLSGGIDSTIICALAQKYDPELEVYTAFSKDSLDLEHAKNFAKMYPTINHHLFEVSFDDLLEIVPDVVYALETFDAALIRSALPMFYICSKIPEDTDILLTGEGADELFGGYSYLKDFSTEELNDALVDLLKIEHATGLQRVDRIPYSFNVDARAPWFDLKMAKLSFNIPAKYKIKQIGSNHIEKWIVREAFKDIIPNSIYKRAKAKFSKGVGTQFYLRDYFDQNISDTEFKANREPIPGIILKNKEELYYWRIFHNQFDPHEDFIRKIPRTEVFIT